MTRVGGLKGGLTGVSEGTHRLGNDSEDIIVIDSHLNVILGHTWEGGLQPIPFLSLSNINWDGRLKEGAGALRAPAQARTLFRILRPLLDSALRGDHSADARSWSDSLGRCRGPHEGPKIWTKEFGHALKEVVVKVKRIQGRHFPRREAAATHCIINRAWSFLTHRQSNLKVQY